MQPVLTTSQSRLYDKHLIEEIGIPSLVLMENAAMSALAAIELFVLGILHAPLTDIAKIFYIQ